VKLRPDCNYCARVNLSAVATPIRSMSQATFDSSAIGNGTRHAKQLQADPRLKAFDDLPVEAILINGSKRILLYKSSIVYDLIRNPELTTKERN
jgi:hypothetical protein